MPAMRPLDYGFELVVYTLRCMGLATEHHIYGRADARSIRMLSISSGTLRVHLVQECQWK